MRILDGELIADDLQGYNNRGLLFGDGVFETIRLMNGRILFWEEHYFRLMSAMRITRMQIPMRFTMEFLETELLRCAEENAIDESGRIRITVFRKGAGLYQPETNEISYLISASALEHDRYVHSAEPYEIELYKDYFVPAQLLSSVKTTSRIVHVTASVFSQENGYRNCLLINEHKNIVEAINANVFLYHNGVLTTPPPSEGCVNGIMRRNVLKLAKNEEGIEVNEAPVSPFDLQKADEIFLTNVISGIIPVSRYRKKDFGSDFSRKLVDRLNESLFS